MQTSRVWGLGATVLALAIGCSKQVEDFCQTGVDCEGGEACDLTAHECIAGSLSIADTGFVIDSASVWWHPGTGLVFTGSLDASLGSEIVLLHAGVPIGAPAVVTGSTWSLAVPDGALPVGTTLDLTVQLRGAAVVEVVVQARLDDVAAVGAIDPTFTIRDERDDVITFPPDAPPVHQHAGAAVALTAETCVDIYKHGYLLTTASTDDNRLAPRFNLTDAFPDTAPPTVRWRLDLAGSEVRAFTDLPAPTFVNGAAQLEVDLRRDGANGVPQLGDANGELNLAVEVTDWAGRTTMLAACARLESLAPPIEIVESRPALASTIAPVVSVPSMRLNSGDVVPVSELLTDGGSSLALKELVIRHSVNESVRVRVAFAYDAALMQRSGTSWRYYVTSSEAVSLDCNAVPRNCAAYVARTPGLVTRTAQPIELPMSLELYRVDGPGLSRVTSCATLDNLTFDCILPPGTSSTEYRAMLVTSGSAELAPTPAEAWLEGPGSSPSCSITRSTQLSAYTACSDVIETTLPNGVELRRCVEQTVQLEYRMLDSLVFGGATAGNFTVETSPSLERAPTLPGYASATGYSDPSNLRWDLGFENCGNP